MYIFAKMYWRIRYDCLKQYVNTYKCWHNVNNNFQTKFYPNSKSKLNLILQSTLVAFLKGFHDIFLCHQPTIKRVSIDTSILIVFIYEWATKLIQACFHSSQFLLLIFTSKKADVWNILYNLSQKDDLSKENDIKVKT